MKKRVGVLILCVFSFIPLWAMFETPAAGAEKSPAYVGSDACKECHQDQYGTYAKSIHAKKAVPGSPAATQGCESCHGPGSAHVEQGGGKGSILAFGAKADPSAKSAACLKCHENTPEVTFWSMGRHKTKGVSCDNCHAVHSTSRHYLKASEPSVCITCHKEVRNQVRRQSHHPMEEGKVKCSDCHTPHGGFGNKMLRAQSVPELCYGCHQEKRGPFAFEHPPVVENCASCHQPHGSNHENLLTSKTPQLCQACHTQGTGHTSRAYTLQHSFLGNATQHKNKFFAQACLNCHGNIHGSNRSPEFLR